MAKAAKSARNTSAQKNSTSNGRSNGNGMSGSNGKSKSNGKASQGGSAVARDSALMELFVDELKDIYWAEKHLVKALVKMQKAAASEELANAFEEHATVTTEHVGRLEEIFEMLGKRAQAKKCEAMEGLVEEGKQIIEDTEEGTATRDVGLIMAAQKVEHYEIATYGSLTTLANVLGLDDVAELLGQTLDEEKETDERLTSIAENDINYEAMEEVE
jgi:ferritin-like metal-binding protein YciE